eukprot:TRINITY_DN16697_c5_g1_i1.p1 TRINITY_DN16697_c5_g1~~TRINITY_DN16697_c5_g1_i1.p1  ORF type:complete len:619 (+),score=101.66 TRINITY_DN16697_c5_g1_i1:67-1923(+)
MAACSMTAVCLFAFVFKILIHSVFALRPELDIFAGEASHHVELKFTKFAEDASLHAGTSSNIGDEPPHPRHVFPQVKAVLIFFSGIYLVIGLGYLLCSKDAETRKLCTGAMKSVATFFGRHPIVAPCACCFGLFSVAGALIGGSDGKVSLPCLLLAVGLTSALLHGLLELRLYKHLDSRLGKLLLDPTSIVRRIVIMQIAFFCIFLPAYCILFPLLSSFVYRTLFDGSQHCGMAALIGAPVNLGHAVGSVAAGDLVGQFGSCCLFWPLGNVVSYTLIYRWDDDLRPSWNGVLILLWNSYSLALGCHETESLSFAGPPAMGVLLGLNSTSITSGAAERQPAVDCSRFSILAILTYWWDSFFDLLSAICLKAGQMFAVAGSVELEPGANSSNSSDKGSSNSSAAAKTSDDSTVKAVGAATPAGNTASSQTNNASSANTTGGEASGSVSTGSTASSNASSNASSDAKSNANSAAPDASSGGNSAGSHKENASTTQTPGSNESVPNLVAAFEHTPLGHQLLHYNETPSSADNSSATNSTAGQSAGPAPPAPPGSPTSPDAPATTPAAPAPSIPAPPGSPTPPAAATPSPPAAQAQAPAQPGSAAPAPAPAPSDKASDDPLDW